MSKALGTVLLLAAACGCAQDATKVGSTPPAPVAEVDSVSLWVRPGALNWDDRPGPDGVQTQVYFFRTDPGHTLPLTVSGTVEFSLYEGNVRGTDLAKARPWRTWKFTARELSGFLSRGWAGWCYSITLPWGAKAPESETVTLVAKYISPDGRELYAAPASIAIGSK